MIRKSGVATGDLDGGRERRRGSWRRRAASGTVVASAAALAVVAAPLVAGAAVSTSTVVSASGTVVPSVGAGVPESSAQVVATDEAVNATNGDIAVAQNVGGQTYVFLIAGPSQTANEFHIQTSTGVDPSFGNLTPGDVYVVAGDGTAGLVGTPGGNFGFGSSVSAVATQNDIAPVAVAFDANGNLLIGGDSGGNSAIQVVANQTGTFYGVAMSAGDLYTVADVGLSGAPSSAINMGSVAGFSGMALDTSGNAVVGDGAGAVYVNFSANPVTAYGTTIGAHSAAIIAGSSRGATDCSDGPANDPAGSLYFSQPAVAVDGAGNVYLSDDETGPGAGCVWLLPAQNGTFQGSTVSAGTAYKLAGNGGASATDDGVLATSANVGSTSGIALDPAGNVLLAVNGSGAGTSAAVEVLAEETAPVYGQDMTAGDIYTLVGGPNDTVQALSGPTSIVSSSSGTAYLTDGTGSGANLIDLSGGPSGRVPGQPSDVVATAGAASATVSFQPPASGPEPDGYTVNATDVTDSARGGQSAMGSVSPITVTGLTNGDSYTFTVTATNPHGSGLPSSPSAAVTPSSVPGKPTGVHAEATNGRAIVSWTAPTNTGGLAITGYHVVSSPGGISCTTPLVTATSCSVAGLTNGRHYTFSVKALNADGYGPASSPSNSVTPATVPSTPSAPVATAGVRSASVSWTAPADGGSAITQYVVQGNVSGARCTANGHSTTCTVHGLTPGERISFKVKAVNALGSSPFSAQSNTVTVKP